METAREAHRGRGVEPGNWSMARAARGETLDSLVTDSGTSASSRAACLCATCSAVVREQFACLCDARMSKMVSRLLLRAFVETQSGQWADVSLLLAASLQKYSEPDR